ncbi:hypothetical protein [Parasphingorhabdus halotolerans]|uniref:Uncharacterized protein n=1 Tax=Parasphingorhabdus halotolerans TaxID=2725558 RepID=A0A6H2DK61_9SPHN|nr:hypothetical protein [Parasphingorhabdus halotolerans]QJB68046.1 hypothetical protein HF685_00925 [Parasphingorhabdus halotolerans]
MTNSKKLCFAIAMGSLPIPVFAQHNSSPPMEDYEDVGQGAGMEWHYQIKDGVPNLEFGVKETGHRLDRLWEFSCSKMEGEHGTISNTIFAKPPEIQPDDQFGFSVRIDKGKSVGLVANRGPFQVQGYDTYFPQFEITDKHDLWDLLRHGKRAYINLNGNKFSIHLDGSAKAIGTFINSCRTKSN